MADRSATHPLDVVNPYAPAQRAAHDEVRRAADQLACLPGLGSLLDAIPALLLILNPQRQVIFANRAVLGLLGVSSLDALHGLRPGEVFDCDHATETGGGCGLSPSCRECGAARALFACEHGAADVQECRITQKTTGRALDLRVSVTPFGVAGQTYTVLALTDISHEKRRRALERIFFHDLLNTVNGMVGYAELLRTDGMEDHTELGTSLLRLTGTMADEIHAQRELLAAENDDLVVRWETVSTRRLLDDVVAVYHNHDAAHRRGLVIDPDSEHVTFPGDRTLLVRVLGNLIRNALEASAPGQTVTLASRVTDAHVEIRVHNPAAMPSDVQRQVFQRSFSTKGPGRGLGTYSIKLLTERYLNGSVWFTSDADTGTTFHLRFQRQRP